MAERRVVVSTECPTCGAPLDFSEGSNSVRCGHCRSSLLVTGRKQILSYWIRPKIEAERARAQASLALKRAKQQARSLEPRLYFLPFYRFTAHDFVWAKPEPKPATVLPVGDGSQDAAAVLGWGPWSSASIRGGAALFSLAAEMVDGLLSSREPAMPPSGASTVGAGKTVPPLHDQGPRYYDDVEFEDHHVEKNFVATDVGAMDLFSIGVRSAVLKLELFSRSELGALGTVVNLDLDPEAAWKRGMMLDRDRVIYRQTLGERLSVIYFPFWFVRAEGGSDSFAVIVDGVSGGVGRSDVPLEALAPFERPAEGASLVASFRPLVCPNCGWDLPADPDEVVFHCGSCHRAWLLQGKDLHSVPHAVVAVPREKRGPSVKYLPFWSMESEGRNVVVPAFRYRQLKHLQMLATRLAKVPQDLVFESEPEGTFVGAFYDPDDAVRMARFVLAGLTVEEGKRVEAEPQLTPPSLLWVPFRAQGNYLFDPFFGMNLFATLLN